MHSRQKILSAVLDGGVIAIVRLNSPDKLVATAEAIREGGITVIEFTLNTPGALEAIHACCEKFGDDVTIGAGTVMDEGQTAMALDAGAEIIVSPNTNALVIGTAHGRGKLALPGAYTPTEIASAMAHGADLVKLFPAKMLGPEYVKEVLAPLDNARLVPTGGVTPDNVKAYFDAGAAAVAVGGGIVNNALVDAGDFAAITKRARSFRDAVDSAREEA